MTTAVKVHSACEQTREEIEALTLPLKVEVLADDSGKWAGNNLKLNTVDEAIEYGGDLWSRWTLCKQWRVVEADEG